MKEDYDSGGIGLIGIVLILILFGVCDGESAELKIDTIRVDTVSITRDSSYVEVACPDRVSSNGVTWGCSAIHWGWEKYWKHNLRYTTDTTYLLTEAEKKLLGLVDTVGENITIVWDTFGTPLGISLPKSAIDTSDNPIQPYVDPLNARIDSLIKVIEGLESLIQFHRRSPRDHNIPNENFGE